MKTKWRNFEKDPPDFKAVIVEGKLIRKETDFLLISDGVEITAVIYGIEYRNDGSSYESWYASGISGYEYDIDLTIYDRSILLWTYAPDLPKKSIMFCGPDDN